MTRITRRELFGIAPALWVARRAAAQQATPTIQVQPAGGKVNLLSGAGGNIAILEAPEGILLVDSGLADNAEAMETRARGAASSKITVLINTHHHFDHVGGNERLGRSGARIIAHENVLKRVSTVQRIAFFNREVPALAPEGRPKSTFPDSGSLTHGGEKVVYRHLPPAHTDGDSTVYFANSDVFHAGDLFFNGMYPFIDYSAGGSIEGMVAAADLMLKAVDASTKIIPGHGPLATRDELRAFRDMLAGINERVTKLMGEGKTVEQAQAAEPTKAFEDKWGKGFLKGADFVRLLYHGKKGQA
jgi:glyoxylase-like metal-dependent hydrolase (beta-lactamase superfamily II)